MSLVDFMVLVPFDFDLLCQLIGVGSLRRRVMHQMVIAIGWLVSSADGSRDLLDIHQGKGFAGS